MSLHPQALSPIPEETARVARAAYPKGNVYRRIRFASDINKFMHPYLSSPLTPPRLSHRMNHA